ncbi:MAG: hypothetical protein LBM93_11085 [Oscillospiraceae bacterium]|jgi:DNA-directed RNA polymerase subunit RPC12/RpoP|nr:hypothetical protein [Oscillospiraceae bacterium]
MSVPIEYGGVLLQNPDLNRGNAMIFLKVAQKTTCRCGGKNCYKARISEILGGNFLMRALAPKADVYACIDCGATYSQL